MTHSLMLNSTAHADMAISQPGMHIARTQTRAELITEALLARIAQGDESAMSELYDRASAAIFGLACRILRDQGAAEEVVHDVLMQVWRKAAEFDPSRGGPTSWLWVIARSRALDRLRARRDQRRELTLDDAPADFLARVSTLEQDVAMQQQAAFLHTALKELSPPQQKVIDLAFFQGLSHQEIAETLREPLGTVKTRIRSGLARLKALTLTRTSEGSAASQFAVSL